VGRISGAHGIRGELKAVSLSDEIGRFRRLQTIWLAADDADGGERREVEGVRFSGRYALLKLKGVDDRTAAERVSGRWIRIPRSECASLPAGSFYFFQLVGLRTVTPDGETIGTVREVLRAPAQDILVIDRSGGEVLVPMVREWVRSVDLEAGVVTVESIEGLI
jgi:16S rRNA processing protein RimM